MAAICSSGSLLLPPDGGPSICKTAHKMWLRILSVALEEELRVLDFSQWLNYHYLASFDCFPLLLSVLTSLIKLTFLAKVFPRTEDEQRTRGRTTAACSVSAPHNDALSSFQHRKFCRKKKKQNKTKQAFEYPFLYLLSWHNLCCSRSAGHTWRWILTKYVIS